MRARTVADRLAAAGEGATAASCAAKVVSTTLINEYQLSALTHFVNHAKLWRIKGSLVTMRSIFMMLRTQLDDCRSLIAGGGKTAHIRIVEAGSAQLAANALFT